MSLRNIQTTTGALDTLIKIKALEKDWTTLLIETEETDELHTIFEDMFFESIPKAHMEIFVTHYHHLSLSQKETFIKEVFEEYKKFGEYGFYHVVFYPIISLSRKIIKENEHNKNTIKFTK